MDQPIKRGRGRPRKERPAVTEPKKIGRPRKYADDQLLPAARPTKKDDDSVDESTDAYLRASNVIEAINANLPQGKHIVPIPKDYVFKKRDREAVSVAFHAAFELAGGVPRFAAWATERPDQFYPLFAKLLPSNTETAVGAGTIQINMGVPPSPLDDVVVVNGKVVNSSQVIDQEQPTTSAQDYFKDL